MDPMVIAALVSAAGSVLSGKISSNRGGSAAIGSGTSPEISPGPALEMDLVVGSALNDFDYEEQLALLMKLQEAGIDLEELGIVGLALGGQIRGHYW